MAKGIPLDPQLKVEIVKKVRGEGIKASQASTLYCISDKSIYTRLREGVVDGNRNLIWENNRLKKELEITYFLLGRATPEMSRPKK